MKRRKSGRQLNFCSAHFKWTVINRSRNEKCRIESRPRPRPEPTEKKTKPTKLVTRALLSTAVFRLLAVFASAVLVVIRSGSFLRFYWIRLFFFLLFTFHFRQCHSHICTFHAWDTRPQQHERRVKSTKKNPHICSALNGLIKVNKIEAAIEWRSQRLARMSVSALFFPKIINLLLLFRLSWFDLRACIYYSSLFIFGDAVLFIFFLLLFVANDVHRQLHI